MNLGKLFWAAVAACLLFAACSSEEEKKVEETSENGFTMSVQQLDPPQRKVGEEFTVDVDAMFTPPERVAPPATDQADTSVQGRVEAWGVGPIELLSPYFLRARVFWYFSPETGELKEFQDTQQWSFRCRDVGTGFVRARLTGWYDTYSGTDDGIGRERAVLKGETRVECVEGTSLSGSDFFYPVVERDGVSFPAFQFEPRDVGDHDSLFVAYDFPAVSDDSPSQTVENPDPSGDGFGSLENDPIQMKQGGIDAFRIACEAHDAFTVNLPEETIMQQACTVVTPKKPTPNGDPVLIDPCMAITQSDAEMILGNSVSNEQIFDSQKAKACAWNGPADEIDYYASMKLTDELQPRTIETINSLFFNGSKGLGDDNVDYIVINDETGILDDLVAAGTVEVGMTQIHHHKIYRGTADPDFGSLTVMERQGIKDPPADPMDDPYAKRRNITIISFLDDVDIMTVTEVGVSEPCMPLTNTPTITVYQEHAVTAAKKLYRAVAEAQQ